MPTLIEGELHILDATLENLPSVKNQIIQYSGGNIQQVTKKFLAMEHRHFEEVHRVACDAYNVPIQITY